MICLGKIFAKLNKNDWRWWCRVIWLILFNILILISFLLLDIELDVEEAVDEDESDEAMSKDKEKAKDEAVGKDKEKGEAVDEESEEVLYSLFDWFLLVCLLFGFLLRI